jgi:predicted nucleotidyltransferase
MGCVYAIGSFGRLEAGPKSDLDLFVVVKSYKRDDGSDEPPKFRLTGTKQIILKRDLIVAVDAAGIPDFDGGGRFLQTHSFDSYTRYLGSQEDDFRNTLTGRMLLLLESKCLVSDKVYDELITSVVNEYFKDFEGKEDRFLPAFLINDIVRMWRTFCVNYEFYRRDKKRDKVKNLKLKFSRMLTCYSSILSLLHDFTVNRTVTPGDVLRVASLTPTERIEFLVSAYGGRGRQHQTVNEALHGALKDYSEFLELVHGNDGDPEKVLQEDEEKWRKRSYDFGAKLAAALTEMAGSEPLNNDLYRTVLI